MSQPHQDSMYLSSRGTYRNPKQESASIWGSLRSSEEILRFRKRQITFYRVCNAHASWVRRYPLVASQEDYKRQADGDLDTVYSRQLHNLSTSKHKCGRVLSYIGTEPSTEQKPHLVAVLLCAERLMPIVHNAGIYRRDDVGLMISAQTTMPLF